MAGLHGQPSAPPPLHQPKPTRPTSAGILTDKTRRKKKKQRDPSDVLFTTGVPNASKKRTESKPESRTPTPVSYSAAPHAGKGKAPNGMQDHNDNHQHYSYQQNAAPPPPIAAASGYYQGFMQQMPQGWYAVPAPFQACGPYNGASANSDHQYLMHQYANMQQHSHAVRASFQAPGPPHYAQMQQPSQPVQASFQTRGYYTRDNEPNVGRPSARHSGQVPPVYSNNYTNYNDW